MNKEQQLIRQYAEQLNRTAFKLVSLLNDIDIEVKKRRDKIIIMTPRHKKPREGCIIQRKDGRFEGRYMQDGKQRSVYAKSYDDCYDKLNAAIDARNKYSARSNLTLEKWLIEYIEVYKRGKVGIETYKQFERDIRLRIMSTTLKDTAISEIRPVQIQKLLNDVPTVRVRENVYNLLSGAFRQAFAERFITYNPMLAVARVKAKRDKGIALTPEEQAEFITAIRGDKLENYFLFCLYTGCRRNEALDVCREDIDERSGIIHIRGTKTEHSDRYIPLFDTLIKILSELPQSGKLFDFKSDYVTKRFKNFCPAHRLHDLRHTFATRALEAGVPMKVVQIWLGHSEISTTADIYSDVSRDLSLSEAKKLDAAFMNPIHDNDNKG